MKQIRIKLSPEAEEVYKHINAQAPTSKLEKMILKAVNQKIELIKSNPHYGDGIPKNNNQIVSFIAFIMKKEKVLGYIRVPFDAPDEKLKKFRIYSMREILAYSAYSLVTTKSHEPLDVGISFSSFCITYKVLEDEKGNRRFEPASYFSMARRDELLELFGKKK
ncbi:MAG TPA: hypothetical protein VJB11_01030 [archaeon]|nr:hypothetical protein [archaeon]